ncbi:MAG: hypothetical protein Q9177_003522 [Variospora cf. flavescens]
MESAGILMMAGTLGPVVQRLLMLWSLYNVKHVTQTIFIGTTHNVPFTPTSAAAFPAASSTLPVASTAASKAIGMLPTNFAVTAVATPVAFVTPQVTPLKAVVDNNSSGFLDVLLTLIVSLLNTIWVFLGAFLAILCRTLEHGCVYLMSFYNARSTDLIHFFRACHDVSWKLRHSTHWGNLNILMSLLVCITVVLMLMHWLATSPQQHHQPAWLHPINEPQPRRKREIALLVSLHLGAAFIMVDVVFELAWPITSPMPYIFAILPYGRGISLIACALLSSINWRLVLHSLALVPDVVDSLLWQLPPWTAAPLMSYARRTCRILAYYWRCGEPCVTWALTGFGYFFGVIFVATASGICFGVGNCLQFFLNNLVTLDFQRLTSPEEELDAAVLEAGSLRKTVYRHEQALSSLGVDKDELTVKFCELSDYKARNETAQASAELKKQNGMKAAESERERVRQIEESVEQLKASNKELKSVNEKLRSTIQELQSEVKCKQDRITKLRDDNHELMDRNRNLAREPKPPGGYKFREKLWQDMAEGAAKQSENAERRSVVQSAEIDDLKKQLKSETETAKSNAERLQLHIDNLEKELNVQRSTPKPLDQQAVVELLRNELDSVKKSLSSSETEHAGTRKALENAQKSIGLITVQHDATKKDLKEAKDKVADLDDKNDQLHGDVDLFNRKIDQLQAQVKSRTSNPDGMDVDDHPIVTGDEQRHPVVAHDDRGVTETQPMDDVKIEPVVGKDTEPMTEGILAPRSGDASMWSQAEIQEGKENPKFAGRRLKYKERFPHGHVPLPSTLDPLNSSLAALRTSIEQQMLMFHLKDGELLQIYTENRTAINDGLKNLSENGVLSDSQLLRILRRWANKYNLYPMLGLVKDLTEEGPKLFLGTYHGDGPHPPIIWLYKRVEDRDEERNRAAPWCGLRPVSQAEANADKMVL